MSFITLITYCNNHSPVACRFPRRLCNEFDLQKLVRLGKCRSTFGKEGASGSLDAVPNLAVCADVSGGSRRSSRASSTGAGSGSDPTQPLSATVVVVPSVDSVPWPGSQSSSCLHQARHAAVLRRQAVCTGERLERIIVV